MTPSETLKNIENNTPLRRSEFSRSLEIWEYIAEQINNTTGEKYKFWVQVMDLHNKKDT